MRGSKELKELRQREERALQTIARLKEEILPVLGEDLLRYPEREVRRRFVTSPDFAESLDDETIAAIKRDLARRAPQVRDRIIHAMSEEDRWLCGVEFEGPGRSLAENPKLWEPTSLAVDLVREVLTAYGFPGHEDFPREYKMPTWFILGKYLPGLAEKYWAAIAELREVRARIREVEEGMVRERLERRWDTVAVEEEKGPQS